jgi:hypothetical protein
MTEELRKRIVNEMLNNVSSLIHKYKKSISAFYIIR